ncbi:MAG: ATP-binding protein, partial [Candidatus Sulfotelmatobacter sp.]
ANENAVTTGFGVELSDSERKRPIPVPSTSLCEPFREAIELGLSQGRNAIGIWQDLVSESGFNGGYQTVKRFVRKLPVTAAEELLEIVMRRYERTSTLLTSNRPVEDWGKLLGDSAAVTAMLDRLLHHVHHGHVLKCGPRSWRTKIDLPAQEVAG